MSYLKIACITLVTCVAGVLLFLLHNDWIIIIPRPQALTTASPKMSTSASFFYPTETTIKKETHTLILSSDPSAALQQLVTEWLNFVQQEGVLSKKVALHESALAHNTDAYISLDTTPFSKNLSTHAKLMLIEALFQTLHAALPTIQTVTLLCNNKPLHDIHLDFSCPWPITGYSETRLTQEQKKVSGLFTILIDPCGDANYKGRTIGDSFERTLAYQTAHLLKKELMAHDPALHVLIMHTTQDTLSAAQHATRANQKDVDLVVSLNFYQEHEIKPRCMIYYYVRDPEKDFLAYKKNRITLEPYDQAYRVSLEQSASIALQLQKNLQAASNTFDYTVLGLPYKPLVGIIKPAVALEIGIKTSEDITNIVPVLAGAINNSNQ